MRKVRQHGAISLAAFDQNVYGFRYNALLRPALSRAAGFLIRSAADPQRGRSTYLLRRVASRPEGFTAKAQRRRGSQRAPKIVRHFRKAFCARSTEVVQQQGRNARRPASNVSPALRDTPGISAPLRLCGSIFFLSRHERRTRKGRTRMKSTLRDPAFRLGFRAQCAGKLCGIGFSCNPPGAENFSDPDPDPDGRVTARTRKIAYAPQTSFAKARKFSPMIFSMRASEWPRALSNPISLRNWSGPLRSTTNG